MPLLSAPCVGCRALQTPARASAKNGVPGTARLARLGELLISQETGGHPPLIPSLLALPLPANAQCGQLAPGWWL